MASFFYVYEDFWCRKPTPEGHVCHSGQGEHRGCGGHDP